MNIDIKYFDNFIPPLTHIGGNKRSTWIDLRASAVEINGIHSQWEMGDCEQYITYKAGDEIRVYVGFAMELPEGHEALTAPRGSTFKNYGLIQVNSPGVVDESFKGDNDQWFIPFYALRDGRLERYDRVAQFRILEKMPATNFHEVEHLEHEDRGGYGSSGVK